MFKKLIVIQLSLFSAVAIAGELPIGDSEITAMVLSSDQRANVVFNNRDESGKLNQSSGRVCDGPTANSLEQSIMSLKLAKQTAFKLTLSTDRDSAPCISSLTLF